MKELKLIFAYIKQRFARKKKAEKVQLVFIPRPHAGQKVWEHKPGTQELTEVQFKKGEAVEAKDGHLYCNAINRPAAQKKLIKMLITHLKNQKK